MPTTDDGARYRPAHIERDGGGDRYWRCVFERPRLRGLARTGAQTDVDRRPHDPRQHIEAWQSLSTQAVCSGRLGGVGQGQATAVGTLWPQILDRGRQEASAPQRSRDSARQQTRPHCLGGSPQRPRLRVRQDQCAPICLILAPCSGPSRRGLEMLTEAATLSRRPALTALARGAPVHLQAGTWRNRGVTTAGTGWPPCNTKGARPCPRASSMSASMYH